MADKEVLQTGGFANLVEKIKAWAFPKTGGTVSGSISATGEVSATETVDGSTVTHNLTDKLDEDDYLAGMTWDYLEAHFTWDDLDGTSTSGQDTYTTNLNLTKPGRLSTAAFNRDMDILDDAVADLQKLVSPDSIVIRVADCPIKTVKNTARVYVIVNVPLNATSCTPAFYGDSRNIYLSGTDSTYTCTSFDGVEMNSDGIAIVRINTAETIAMAGIHGSNAAPYLQLSFGY